MEKHLAIIKAARNWFRAFLVLSMFSGYLVFIPVQQGKALAIIRVNSTNDSLANDGQCTLREAVIAANKDAPSGKKPGECMAGSGADTILLPFMAGGYVLTRTDNGKEDSSSTGDLDISNDLTIEALDPGVVIKGNANFTDRIFHIISGQVLLRGLSIEGGAVKGDGGGIYNLASLKIENSTISSNQALGQGGGVYNATSASLTLVNSTLSANASLENGGGLYNLGSAVLNNVTISNNKADQEGDGAGDGGGLASQGGTVQIRNTIVGGNFDLSSAAVSPDCSGTLFSDGYNLIGDSRGCILSGNTSGNLLDVNPNLDILKNNGGFTPTQALLPDSPAIDAGNPATPGSGGNACEVSDQRGVYRPRGPACDIGAYETGHLNSSIIIRAFSLSGGSSTTAVGRLSSAANLTYNLQFYAAATCNPVDGNAVGDPVAITTDGSGNVIFNASLDEAVAQGLYLWAVTQDDEGNLSDPSACVRVGAGNDSWPNAMQVDPLDSLNMTSEVDQFIDLQGQSRWYKFPVQPNSQVVVTLTDLPVNYDLTLYKDISQAFSSLGSSDDLNRLGAEFAPDAFSPDAFSPDAFSPDAFSPDAFSPDAFSPDAFSPDAFSPDAFSPDAFSPDAFSPDAFSPDAFSPDAFSPDAFSPDAFSPDAFSPDAFSPDAFSSAQTRSLIAISAFDGVAGEGVKVNTWDSNSFFYIRVRGRNGAFNPDLPFHLAIQAIPGYCSNLQTSFVASTTQAEVGGYRTLILTDLARMQGSADEKAALVAKLGDFAGRIEVAGKIVDLSQDDRVSQANQQADGYPACPYAKNLVAASIKEIVDAFWDVNPGLQYLVIVGNDETIPFFRHPDHAMLGNERNYVVPVRDNTPSQASLKLGYVYSQDDYGARKNVSIKDDAFPIMDLATGRLVETAADVIGMLDAYLLNTDQGVVDTPTSALVTGYDFLEDVSNEVRDQLGQGLNAEVDTLISGRDVPPTVVSSLTVSPSIETSWTAEQLRGALLGERHDLIFLAGHFSANAALAADFTTRLLSSELESSSVDLKNAIIYSVGCHAGYNIVNGDGIAGVTKEPDWAQAFAGKQATLIAGTGYQYGDTDFIRYSERIYLEFTRELRAGSGPVSVGQALVKAKRAYLASTPYMRGIDEKAVLEATLFGLPMLSVDMPGARLEQTGYPAVVNGTQTYESDPGLSLGLQYFDLNASPTLTQNTVTMKSLQDSSDTDAVYFSGPQGIISNPNEPVLPHAIYNVSVPGTVLRGVGLRSGDYQDLQDVLPLTGAAATEIRGVHTPIISNVFFPSQTWRVNYFAALDGGDTLLSVFPTQYQSSTPSSSTGTLRHFNELQLRLFYSNNIDSSFTGQYESTPALSAPPSIVTVSSQVENGQVFFQARVVGNPAAGIQEVWVTYTGLSGSYAGTWESLDLARNAQDSTLWEGSLALNGSAPGDIRYVVQAVNGVGLVSMDSNQGAYYIAGAQPSAGQASQLEFVPSPGSSEVPSAGRYSEQVTLSARLSSNGMPLASKSVAFTLGPQTRLATTDNNGLATVALSIFGLPGDGRISASFGGDEEYQAVYTTNPFTTYRQNTKITLLSSSVSGYPEDESLLIATLSDDDGISGTDDRRLTEETLFFVVNGNGITYYEAVITDYAGRASLGPLPLPPGEYNVDVYFSGNVPLAEQVSLVDERYLPAVYLNASLALLNRPPVALDDAYATDEDTPIYVAASGVLANDTDPEGAALTAILLSEPAHGQLDFKANGEFTYTPDQDFNGNDFFTYQASDGMDASNVANVSIAVSGVNDAPVAEADLYSTDEDMPLVIQAPGVLGNDTDVDGDGISAILVTQPMFGTLTLNQDGSFTYTPDPDFNGGDSFTYQASDGQLASEPVPVSLTIEAVNDAPLCSLATPSATEIWSPNKGFVTVTVENVSDPEGDPFSLNITAVFQDEPVVENPDAINLIGNSVDLRADRDGKGNGRFYHLFFTAADIYGASCSGQVVVGVVSHDQSDKTPIDGGPLYDSTQPE